MNCQNLVAQFKGIEIYVSIANEGIYEEEKNTTCRNLKYELLGEKPRILIVVNLK